MNRDLTPSIATVVEHARNNYGQRRHLLVGKESRLRTAASIAVAMAVMLAAAQGGAQAPCVGDCNNQGHVTVSDIVLGVNIVLGSQPASACPNFQNGQGIVDVAQLVEGVNNLLLGCNNPSPTPTRTPFIPGTERRFAVAPGTPQADSTMSTSGLFTSGLSSNANAATAICGKLSADGQSCVTPGEMTLVLGDEDDSGIRDFVLKDDVSLEIGIVDGSRICLTFLADTSVGNIDCDGGTPYDIEATRPAGAPGLGFTFRTHLGPLASAGNGEMLVDTRVKILPPTDTTPCDQVTNPDQLVFAFTTTIGTATVGSTGLALSVGGQAFSCDNFATPGSGGMLTAPLPANQAPVGDVVNALRFGEAP